MIFVRLRNPGTTQEGRRFRSRLRVSTHLLIALVCLVPAAAETQDNPRHLRVLAIYSGSSTLAANVAIEVGMATVFSNAESPLLYELYGEFRDAQRFASSEDERHFMDALEAKYQDQPIDVIVTIGPEALPLALDYRDRMAPTVPVVFGGIQDAVREELSQTAGTYGVVSNFDLRGTFELARRLQPQADRAVVFAGSANFDERWMTTARQELADVSDIEIDLVSGLALQELMDRASELDPSDILIVLTIFEDADGRQFVPVDAVAAIAEVSGAPTYGVYSSNVGRGVVGGSFSTFEATGAAIAEQALMVLKDPTNAETSVTVPVTSFLDWRQLNRYGLDPDLRPADSQLLYYDPGIWDRYKLEILGALAIIILQSSTIAALIIMERRRRRASEELAHRRMEMARLSRIAQLGELSGAIAHELNQPLTSILANAEAGAALLEQRPPDLAEVAEVLRDIADDDRRAADVIVNLRRLMGQGGVGFESVDLNTVVQSTMRLVSNEMLARGITVQLQLSRDTLIVKADTQQLQQVLLNLVINAADAMSEQVNKTMTIATGCDTDQRRLLTVSDTGAGLPEELRENPFKPFATSKTQGMGLGLSISQNIAEAHGGTLRIVRSDSDGASIELALPAP